MNYAACALVINPFNGHILACTRRGTTDQWGLIGGKVDDFDESTLDTITREFREETGCGWPKYSDRKPFFDAIDVHNVYDTFTNHVYRAEATSQIMLMYGQGQRVEIEPDILVGFVPLIYLIHPGSPFADFNQKLFNQVLSRVATNYTGD